MGKMNSVLVIRGSKKHRLISE